MNLIVTGRGVELNDRLREYASDKLTRAQKYFDRILKMEVEFSEERNPRVGKAHFHVDVTVKTPGETFRAKGTGMDFFAAIDQAEDRLETQLRKFKERLIDRGHRADTPNGPPGASERMVEWDEEDGPRIVRQRQSDGKPMSPEEAVLELEAANLQFLLFTNAESMAPGVLYRRPDGSYGLIEAGA